MQQPGLQQLSSGWPGMPGLQTPVQSQAQPSSAPSFPPQPFSSQPFQGQPFPSQQPMSAQQAYQPPFAAQQPPFPSQQPPFPSQQPPFPNQQAPLPFQQFQLPPAQGQIQPQAAQAAPVAPVAFPAPNHTSGGPAGAGAPPNPAQALARQLIDVARLLEQALPGYQMTKAMLLDLAANHQAAGLNGLDEATASLKEATYYHGATLGAIRRLLIGEMTPGVLTMLATSYQLLNDAQTQLRPLLDRLFAATPLTLRPSLNGLGQSLASADTALNQAGTALQSIVGPQVWESARGRLASARLRSDKTRET